MIIYALIDPVVCAVKYIGTTRRDPKKRLYHHIGARHDGSARGNWILALHNRGLRPVISVLEEVDDSLWIEAEERWIATYRDRGASLLNAGTGGPGMRGATMSDQTKAKVSAAKRGKSITFANPAERARKIADSRKGRPMSAETKRKLSEINKGKFKTTPEERVRVIELFQDGYSRVDIAKMMGHSRDAVSDIIKRDAEARGITLSYKRSARTIAKMTKSNHYVQRAAELAAKYESELRAL